MNKAEESSIQQRMARVEIEIISSHFNAAI
jgi:hypothetical protein